MTIHGQEVKTFDPDEARRYADDWGVRVNWGRWGVNDQRGTLNEITPANVEAAARSVRAGTIVRLGAPLDPGAPAYYPQALETAARHEVITTWGSNAGGGVQAASDQLHVQCHGLDTTHMDALCHIGLRGVGWNGQRFEQMLTEDGALVGDIDQAGPVVTRAVLVDVPRQRGIDHLEPGDRVTDRDLLAADLDLRPGDALLVRTGRARAVAGHRRAADAEGRSSTSKYGPIAGLHPSAMRLIGDLDCSLLGTDGPGDAFPALDAENPLPVHVLSLVHLGLHLLHNLALEELADALDELGRSDFMIMASPLRLPRGTGSPIAPVAVL
ncbi:cyclase family protein [Janibacter melonis]|uniref:cyclase family protein n=1 Tax=Janibacter melonis TaxID=262209 RepID=UPI0017809E59|nr:cyclase family protein [Janibacter melonis]